MWRVVLLLFASMWWLLRDSVGLATWKDEAWSLTASQQPSLAALLDFLRTDVHPPLYFVIGQGWQNLVGDTFFANRVLSIFMTLVALVLTYRMAKDWFGQRAALVAFIIVATSDLVFVLGTEVRHYPLYLVVTLISMWAYDKQRWLIYTLSGLALIYTLYWGVFILLAQGIHALLHGRARQLIIPAAVISISYLPWLPVLVDQASGGGLTIQSDGYESGLELNRTGFEIIFFQLFGIPEALFAGLALGALVLYRLDERLRLLAMWLSVPLLLGIAITAGGYNILLHRPLIALIPAVAILAGATLSTLQPRFYILLLGIIVVNNLTTVGAVRPERGPWWELGDVVFALSSPHDVLHIESDLHVYVIEQHTRDAPQQGTIRAQQIGDRETVNNQLSEVDRLWLIEFVRDYDVRQDLANLGFAQVTPTLDFGDFLIDRITLTYFARPSDAAPEWIFAESLGLQAFDFFVDDEYLRVNLDWVALQDPGQDYTVSVFLLNESGQLVAQHDSFPLEGRSPTVGWVAGFPYFDRHSLPITDLPAGDYRLGVRIYTWWDGQIYPPTPTEDFASLATVTLGRRDD